MVSVMAVKIQLSSPRGVLRLFCCPGILSMMSGLMPWPLRIEREQNHCSAILMGVVRHALKRSAGSSADCGRSSSAPHAASKITSFIPDPNGIAPPIVSSPVSRRAAADAAFSAAAAAPVPITLPFDPELPLPPPC